jgi:hypothetical protein
MSPLNSRVARIVVGLAVASAFAVAPMAAQAATTDATGTLTGGSLSNNAPAITAFDVTLSGINQTVTTDVGATTLVDARGTKTGYTVTVAATAPTVGGVEAGAGTGGSIKLTPGAASATAGNAATTVPTVAAQQTLSTTASTIYSSTALAPAEGSWDLASGNNLEIVIPGNATAGAYSSTLTYTTAALVP